MWRRGSGFHRGVTGLGALALLSFALCACTNTSARGSREPVEEGTHFISDDDGRVVILRGMNIMSSSQTARVELQVTPEA